MEPHTVHQILETFLYLDLELDSLKAGIPYTVWSERPYTLLAQSQCQTVP